MTLAIDAVIGGHIELEALITSTIREHAEEDGIGSRVPHADPSHHGRSWDAGYVHGSIQGAAAAGCGVQRAGGLGGAGDEVRARGTVGIVHGQFDVVGTAGGRDCVQGGVDAGIGQHGVCSLKTGKFRVLHPVVEIHLAAMVWIDAIQSFA